VSCILASSKCSASASLVAPTSSALICASCEPSLPGVFARPALPVSTVPEVSSSLSPSELSPGGGVVDRPKLRSIRLWVLPGFIVRILCVVRVGRSKIASNSFSSSGYSSNHGFRALIKLVEDPNRFLGSLSRAFRTTVRRSSGIWPSGSDSSKARGGCIKWPEISDATLVPWIG